MTPSSLPGVDYSSAEDIIFGGRMGGGEFYLAFQHEIRAVLLGTAE